MPPFGLTTGGRRYVQAFALNANAPFSLVYGYQPPVTREGFSLVIAGGNHKTENGHEQFSAYICVSVV
jgi:hypothetical protein